MKLETKDYIIGGIALGSLALGIYLLLSRKGGTGDMVMKEGAIDTTEYIYDPLTGNTTITTLNYNMSPDEYIIGAFIEGDIKGGNCALVGFYPFRLEESNVLIDLGAGGSSEYRHFEMGSMVNDFRYHDNYLYMGDAQIGQWFYGPNKISDFSIRLQARRPEPQDPASIYVKNLRLKVLVARPKIE